MIREFSECTQAVSIAGKGGLHFHPTDEDLCAGAPDRKKLLDRVLSVHTISENAMAAESEACPQLKPKRPALVP